jgi:hypothetical protein
VSASTEAHLEALIAEATADCYNEDEQVTGFLTMIGDDLAVPFTTWVLGVEATVEGVDVTAAGEIVAICSREELRQTIPILDLPLPAPAPEGAEWIDAYRRWRG